jgi:hypothetical protein
MITRPIRQATLAHGSHAVSLEPVRRKAASCQLSQETGTGDSVTLTQVFRATEVVNLFQDWLRGDIRRRLGPFRGGRESGRPRLLSVSRYLFPLDVDLVRVHGSLGVFGFDDGGSPAQVYAHRASNEGKGKDATGFSVKAVAL